VYGYGYEGFRDDGDGSFVMHTVVRGVYVFRFEWEA
jgi:hypothetical protein